MKAILQRVSKASVTIADKNYHSEIKKGILILLGIKTGDTESDVEFVADKCTNLRIFPRRDGFPEDDQNKMNISVKDIDGEVLIISQFTLYGDTSKGNRPGFTEAAKPEEAIPLYESFINRIKENIGKEKVKTGIFGAMMDVQSINYGPVTVIVESKKPERSNNKF
ncbi:MAG TPA: D-aminoacyl-tRNA deacylase [Ignavibacteriaceae bacterium]|nr:D-aminoacyl-tRNA deacylase [Ignavibacteriaceae bacterium]